MIMMIPAGGAVRDSLASRLMKEARRVAGRCLHIMADIVSGEISIMIKIATHVELRNNSSIRKNRARYLR